MNSKVILYIASSLNGKIARTDGSVDWLENVPNPEQTDHGYTTFYKSMKYTIQGRKTYEQLISWDIPFPYPSTENYVVTSKHKGSNEHVQFWNRPIEDLVQTLKAKGDGSIWLIGGGTINTNFWNADLIDEIHLFIMPVIIPDGLDVFQGLPKEKYLHLRKQKVHSSGAVELQYAISESIPRE